MTPSKRRRKISKWVENVRRDRRRTVFHVPSLVDFNWTVTDIKLWLPPKLLITSCIPPPVHCHVRGPPWQMNTNFQRYGKASEPQTPQPIEKYNLYLPHLHLAPLLVVIPSEFHRYLLHREAIDSQGYHAALCLWSTFSHFDTVPACDGQTCCDSRYHASIALSW